ncbi:D-2-hydroxyacid dehydrogenase [Halapricum hydrolyticum]|uniref:D-2-hydroxyacid dehydrogenase n=1 Tax=Halapricum hydrolyticum TaxID=2979991 RepID=A0AAE3LKB9_9EURY|nr:D-2-hydroxyacid dehydrogenase [Halapricum hydrolyticum]MCU4719332.1 D-2-hydroxyacid dehydrogenase [Halapricum hydrolyticum]MCU4728223.1 D-2-hydroxyacid dehydrogenase [Halapricum hydrolyticum]
MSELPEVLVLPQKPHGIPVESLVESLRERYDGTVSLARTNDAIDEALPDASVVVGNYISTDRLDRADSLELFACSYAGTDHLPLSELTERGVTVTNAGGVHASNVAEHAVGSLLSLIRGFFRARRQQRNHEWRNFQMGELAGRTVTVVGLGAIGSAIARRLQPFDVDLRAIRHTPEKGGPVDSVFGYGEAEAALAGAEGVVLACPLTETTEGLLGRDEFDLLDPDAVVVNVARGGVIETDALVDALRWNHIRGAALDVTDPEPLPSDHPLWDFENVLITPHNGGYTPEYYDRLADIVVENVERAVESREWTGLRNQVVP